MGVEEEGRGRGGRGGGGKGEGWEEGRGRDGRREGGGVGGGKDEKGGRELMWCVFSPCSVVALQDMFSKAWERIDMDSVFLEDQLQVRATVIVLPTPPPTSSCGSW